MMEKTKKVQALVLLSGGLDSILAVKLLLEQGIEVEALNFRTNFCGPAKARPAAKMLEVPLREVNIREEFLEVLRKPKYGYGAGMNPCIDCHALMLKKAGEIMRAENSCPERSRRIDFVATGEVLGERPMSQHKQALKIVEKEAELEGYLLRPLSAKLLEPTVPELDSRVERDKLYGISGRSRRVQMALAERFGIREYPTPAGGCALTQKDFAERLRELMANKPDFNPEDVDLVRFGRHFWFGGSQIILGRHQEENKILELAAKSDDILVAPENFIGPTALLRGGRGGKIEAVGVQKAEELIFRFSPKVKNNDFNKISFLIK